MNNHGQVFVLRAVPFVKVLVISPIDLLVHKIFLPYHQRTDWYKEWSLIVVQAISLTIAVAMISFSISSKSSLNT